MSDTLYVHRPLLNASDIIDWAVDQGFEKTLDPDDMHVTIAFSKKKFDTGSLEPNEDELHVQGGDRSVIPLGEKGATVLKFNDPKLHQRWKEIRAHGASWEHNGYRPHVTITYGEHDLDLKTIEPYAGPLIFGPEEFAPVVLDWDEKITEIPLVTENRGVLTSKSSRGIKYDDSIKGNNNMATESLASLLVKNIDLILEAFNVDEKGNLVEVNKKKVQESDEIFHKYFVKSMNHMFRQINEADPIMHDPNNMMDPMGGQNGMHQMGGHQMGHQGHMGMEHGMGGPGTDDMLGDMVDGDMDAGGMGNPMGHQGQGHMGNPMGQQGQMGGGAPQMGGGGMGGGPAMESAQGDYDWVFNEETDLDIDSLFETDEEEEVDEEDEDAEGDDQLNEFGMGFGDEDPMDDQMGGGSGGGGSMGMDGGANDFGGDMGGSGMSGGMDHGMGGGGGMGHGMGGDDGSMGGDDDMMTIHGTTDGGGEFEFSFDPDTLGFDGGDGLGRDDEMGGEDDMSGGMGDMGGDDGDDEFGGGHESHGGSHEGGSHGGGHHQFGSEDEDEPPVAEAMKPKKRSGSRGKMDIVPRNPAASHAAPFPTPQGTRQRRK